MEEFRTELSVVEDYLHVLRGKYPDGFSKAEKANLRRKCRNNFMMDKGVLHYRKNTEVKRMGMTGASASDQRRKKLVFLSHAILELQVRY